MNFVPIIFPITNISNITYRWKTLSSKKTAQMNIDGEVKTVRVANVSASTVASPSALVYPTVDATTAWTTDTSTAAVGDFIAATDGTNTVYYQVIA